ncbi:hypothetical protein KJ359_003251 [Pestalotiopsis sp. 9143b]|nr:hypothetical protein KJ359_003251 [Pestalotiopsis sp. 9143b]
MTDEVSKAGPIPKEKAHTGLSHLEEKTVLPLREEAQQDAVHIDLGWRSWLVVFITCFAKYLAALPPLIAFAGAVISAKATSMSMLIGGGILIGTTLPTIAIVQAIPSEILPLKYRALANGFAYLGGSVGGLEYPKMSVKEYIWACDPVGSFLFTCSATLMLLALDWAAGEYAWSSATIIAPLTIGLVLLVLFLLYVIEWKGRADGLIAHVFFYDNLNFFLSVFAFAVEGWIFYSAFNSITPQLVLNLGFEDNAWSISVRQLSTQLPTLLTSIPITLYATKFKDLKSPLLVTFTLFLAVTISYAAIQPSWNRAQIALNVLAGMGQSGPLTLLVACVQFTASHAYLSTATGLAFSARAIGGAFGSAVLNAIINGRLSTHYASAVADAATSAGLPESAVAQLLEALGAGEINNTIQGATAEVWSAAIAASHWEYAHAYRLAWASIIPFVVLAIVAVACLKGVKDLMTDKVEAPIEPVKREEDAKVV